MAGNNEFFEALTMLEHERGITAEYLIEKIRAAIVIAVKKNYDVEDDNVSVEIDPATGVFNVALVQDVVADEDWENEHTQIPLSKAQTLRRTYQPGDARDPAGHPGGRAQPAAQRDPVQEPRHRHGHRHPGGP